MNSVYKIQAENTPVPLSRAWCDALFKDRDTAAAKVAQLEDAFLVIYGLGMPLEFKIVEIEVV